MAQKDAKTIKDELARPFAPEDLEWRIQYANEKTNRGIVVPYVTNRAIQARLDEVVGIAGWYNDYKPWHGANKKEAQICGISIYFEERGGFITKWDGAEDSDIEPVKGGLSDSMKRAAAEWGVGRYLYGMTQIWVKIVQRGKGFFIVDEEQPKLDKAHEDWVRKISGLRDGSYLVCGAVLKPTVSGQSRMNIQLQKANGQKFQAYTHGPDTRLAPGVIIYNVKVSIRNSGGLTFYVLDAYELAADTAEQAA